MLYVLFGQDTYRSRKKLREITDRFYAVAGGRESAIRIVLPESSRLEVEQVLTTGSLFRDKRLLVVEEPSEAVVDVVAYLEQQVPTLAKSNDIYVIWDRVPANKKTGFFAALIANATKTQEFGQLTTQGSARFLDEEARERGISLSSFEKRRILTNGAGDSWRIIQELEKSALAEERAHKETHGVTDVALETDRAIFNLIDAYGNSARAKTWQIYNTLVRAGMDPEKIFWRLLSHTRTMLSIHSLIRRGVAMADIPRLAGVHPFVAKKVALTAARIPKHNLMRRHSSLVSLDFQTKQSRGDIALGLERILLLL